MFVKLDKRIFEEKNLDISLINSEEEIIENLKEIKLENDKFYKILLKGTNNIEINPQRICKLVDKKNILKIKNYTRTKCDFDNIAKQKNLKGIFVKNLIEQMKANPEDEESIKQALEIGLKLFE